MSAPRYRVTGYWYIYKLDPDHWPVKGTNTVKAVLLARDQDLKDQFCQLIDVELETKYLKGKNFHRSYVDQDLGRSYLALHQADEVNPAGYNLCPFPVFAQQGNSLVDGPGIEVLNMLPPRPMLGE